MSDAVSPASAIGAGFAAAWRHRWTVLAFALACVVLDVVLGVISSGLDDAELLSSVAGIAAQAALAILALRVALRRAPPAAEHRTALPLAVLRAALAAVIAMAVLALVMLPLAVMPLTLTLGTAGFTRDPLAPLVGYFGGAWAGGIIGLLVLPPVALWLSLVWLAATAEVALYPNSGWMSFKRARRRLAGHKLQLCVIAYGLLFAGWVVANLWPDPKPLEYLLKLLQRQSDLQALTGIAKQAGLQLLVYAWVLGTVIALAPPSTPTDVDPRAAKPATLPPPVGVAPPTRVAAPPARVAAPPTRVAAPVKPATSPLTVDRPAVIARAEALPARPPVDPRVQIKRWALASVPSIIAVAWIGGLDIDAPAWQVLVWLAAVIQLAWAAVKVYRAVRLVISRRRSGTLRR